MTVVADQTETVAFLTETLAGRGGEVRTVTTHASLVLLGHDRAYKLKRAVRFSFLDFSTPERRLRFCQDEVSLNRRTAPSLYLGARAVTREADGRLALDGSGVLVDAVVEMRRFADRDLFDDLARRDALTPALLTRLARQIAAFHRAADVSKAHGGARGVARVLDINEGALRAAPLFDAARTEALARAFREAFQRHEALLEARREAGEVRRCHGDLILRNICLFEGEPTLFDCLEFDEDLATTDVLYDLAFLLMDLWHRDRRDEANLVFNRYLDEADETGGLPLVPFFMGMRAAVRAHVTAVQAEEAPPDRSAALREEALAYFDLARALLEPAAPVLVAVGGLSGSGKSTAAAAIAPSLGAPPGARVLSSDRIRKALHGVSAETRLPEAAYQPEVSERVYAELRDRARRALAAGCAVVADAVFDREADRAAIERVAREAGVPFAGFWLEAPLDVLLDRLGRRTGDPSDATAAVLLAQAARDRGELTWMHVDAEDGTRARDAMLAPSRRGSRDGRGDLGRSRQMTLDLVDGALGEVLPDLRDHELANRARKLLPQDGQHLRRRHDDQGPQAAPLA